jgi:pyridoxal phosphate enzyme (YggS family)
MVDVMADSIRRNAEVVREKLAAAAGRSGRSPDEIRLMGVSKFQPLEAIYAARDSGIDLFGENRVREREEKISLWEGPRTECHMVGHLQRNKARKAVGVFDCVESVDSVGLALAIDRVVNERAGLEKIETYPIMIEVNVSGEESKQGVAPEKCFALIHEIAVKCSGIVIEGLMTIGPLTGDERVISSSFASLRRLRDEAREKFDFPMPHLSMGMSGDYAEAVAEGSTIVRVGTAIFGARRR